VSDNHSPISVLSTGAKSFRSERAFRFLVAWSTHNDVVKKAWDPNVHDLVAKYRRT